MLGKVRWIEHKKYGCRCCSWVYEAFQESGEAAGLISLATVCWRWELAREREYQLKRLSRSSAHKKRKWIGSFARSHLKKWQNQLGKLLLPPKKEGLLHGLRITRRLTLFWIGLAYWRFYLTWVVLLILGECLLIYMGWVESCLQVLVPLAIKNKRYFGCCADLVKELKKVCFDLVAHFPLVLLMTWLQHKTYFFILKIACQVCMPPVTWCIGGWTPWEWVIKWILCNL